MRSKLSVLTPCSPASLNYLGDAGQSVEKLRDSAPFDVEWVVCLDGVSDTPPPLPNHILIRTPERWGVAGARNQALVNCSGNYVFPLDADDLLAQDGVIAAVKFIESHEKHGWVSGNRLYLNRKKTPHWVDSCKRWDIESVSKAWTVPFPFHPNCLIIKTGTALSVGGWPALPANEDLALLFAVNRVSSGVSLNYVLTYYREHPNQTIKSSLYLENKKMAFCYMERVENAWRDAKSLQSIKAPKV